MSLDVPAWITQEEGHTGFLIHLPSAVNQRVSVVGLAQSTNVTFPLRVLHTIGHADTRKVIKSTKHKTEHKGLNK